MRLIDADELIEELKKHHYPNPEIGSERLFNAMIDAFIEMVENRIIESR